MTVPVPRWLADTVARLVQHAPGSVRVDPDISFAELPATTSPLRIPTRHGELDAVHYAPPPSASAPGVYLNLHGGGFVIGHPEQDDALCRYLAAHAGVHVLNLDYLLAPHARFPAPVEQAYDAACWAAAPGRPWAPARLAIGGQSAGGALAAGAARLALENRGPEIALQVLMYPPLDLTVAAGNKYGPGKERLLVAMGPVFDAAYCPDVAMRRPARLTCRCLRRRVPAGHRARPRGERRA